MDETEPPARTRFSKSLFELLGDSVEKPPGLTQVRLISRQKHVFIHEFGQPLPPQWQWAEKSIDKLHKEIAAGSPPELLEHYVASGGEVTIVQGRDSNQFYEYAGLKHRDKVNRVAFVSSYKLPHEEARHAAIVLLSDNYVTHNGSMRPDYGDRYFQNGNTLFHELGHAADIRTGPEGEQEVGFTGRHSESPLFLMALKLDRLINTNKSFEHFVEAKLSREYDTRSSRSHERIAIASENYHSNKTNPLGTLMQTYFKSVIVGDMALRAEGKTAAMDKLAKGLDNPPYNEIFGGQLGPAVKAWVQGGGHIMDNYTRVILANKDQIVSRLTDYLESAVKIANNATSRGWNTTRT